MSKAVSQIFGGSTPDAPEPTAMPIADDEAAKKAKKLSIAKQRARSGRQSTILSEEKLG